jgi:hypothetical protein
MQRLARERLQDKQIDSPLQQVRRFRHVVDKHTSIIDNDASTIDNAFTRGC